MFLCERHNLLKINMELDQITLETIIEKAVKKLERGLYINQNLLTLIFALAGLVFVEMRGLENESVKAILLVLAWASLFSVLSSLLAYSIEYWNKKTKDN